MSPANVPNAVNLVEMIAAIRLDGECHHAPDYHCDCVPYYRTDTLTHEQLNKIVVLARQLTEE